ncbi:MAG: iron-sulfur cluster assembly accessory protein [Ignavibacteria bacterium]|nr:iron-sulfur cluster assembly accessory protein [Ignavibacteria bacterium]
MENTINDIECEIIDSEVLGGENDDMIRITHKAIEVIKKVRVENNVPDEYYLRIGTRGGGCSGMNYTLGFDSQVNENDKSFKLTDMEMVIDAKSIFYLMGITLDYTESPDGSGFVFISENELPTCGCSH